MEEPAKTPEESLKEAAERIVGEKYVLRLFVVGMTSRSTRAVANIRSICEAHLTGGYVLQVVDLYEEPALAQSEQIVAAPTCVRRFPLPQRRVVGDMSDTGRVLTGLQLGGHR